MKAGDRPGWSPTQDALHRIRWTPAGADEEPAYLTVDEAVERLERYLAAPAEDLRAGLLAGGVFRTAFAYYELVD